MLRREIKQFILDIGGGSEQTATVPFTLCSALADGGVIDKENGIPEECGVKKMKATASFAVDEVIHSCKYSYLRVSGITSPATLYLNGENVGRADGRGVRLLFDLGDKLRSGENTLTFEFESPRWDSGILFSAELLRFNYAIIDEVRIAEARDGDAVSLNVEMTTVGSPESSRGVATLISGAGQIYYGGFAGGKATIRIGDPLFWQPSGLGVQNIYKLTVNLYGESEAEDSLEFKVGLRALKDAGEGMLSINGSAFLPMGSVYIPERIYFPEETRKRTAAFITSAAMAGFNSFVLRGDRLPGASFFDLCDVHGIAVIYETAEASTNSLRAISAVAHHPSFVRLDIIGKEDEAVSEKIKEMIPGITYSFIPEAANYFGEASIPSDRVLGAKVAPEDRNVFSAKMEEQSGGECQKMAASAAEQYLYAWSPSDFAYLTRLTQAENTKKEILRRRRALGKEGRAIFSEISAERLISSSSLDTGAGWKALQYYAKDFFKPVAVTAETKGASVSFIVVNNRDVAVFGLLEYRVIDNENKVIYKYSEEIDIAENSSRTVFTHDLSDYIASHESERFIEYSFTEGNSILSHGTTLFVAPKYFRYKNPSIKAEISGAERRYSVTLSAEAYAGRVELSFTEADAVFSDNYFDITSDVPVKVTFTTSSPLETAKSLKKQLKIKSLYDIGKL